MKITTSRCRIWWYCWAVELHVADVDYGCCRWSLRSTASQTQWPLLLSVSFSVFSFLPSFCFVHSISWDVAPGTQPGLSSARWLSACSRRQKQCFSLPQLSLLSVFPSMSQCNRSSHRMLWSSPPPRDSLFPNLSESCPASCCCKPRASWCSELMNLHCSAWNSHRHTWCISERLY